MTPYLNSDEFATSLLHDFAMGLRHTIDRYCNAEDDDERLSAAYMILIHARCIIEESSQDADYDIYLKSGWWKSMANRAKIRDGHTCRLCGVEGREIEGAAVLHAHHVSYIHKGSPRELDDLITLCADCHARHHGKTR